MAGQIPSSRLLFPVEVRRSTPVTSSQAAFVCRPLSVPNETTAAVSSTVKMSHDVPYSASEWVLGRVRRSQLRRSVFGGAGRVLNRSGHVGLRRNRPDIARLWPELKPTITISHARPLSWLRPCLDGRRSSQRRGRLQGMGSILGKALDDRKRNRDCLVGVRSKRPRTRSLGCRARETKRMRNRHCEQTGPVRALRLCHVAPGAPFKLGLLSVTGMQHDQNSSSADESSRRLPGLAAIFPRGDALRMRRLGVTA
jgi:hypothetical protein